jgi:L-lactate dehydrogenase complex protein LldG
MTGSGKDVILARIRSRIGTETGRNAHTGNDAAISWDYRTAGSGSREQILERFVDRVSDYRATVSRAHPSDLSEAVAAALRSREVRRLVTPTGLPERWLEGLGPGKVEVLRDGVGQQASTNDGVASCEAVLTGCALAIAETGTVVLDSGPAQGRRALTLLPDFHVCVVFGDQVVETVPEAVRAMGEGMAARGTPLTLVSGPSATSDIELTRVEGVHGPRNLWVILVEEEP